MDKPSVSIKKQPCPACGSTDIAYNLKMQKSVEAGWVGLDYKALGPMHGTEPLLADLCLNCGTVCRLHVINTGRRWYAEKGSD